LLFLIWAHGVWMGPPNNYATVSSRGCHSVGDGPWVCKEGLGFLGFWFLPHKRSAYHEARWLMVGLTVPALIVLAWWLGRVSGVAYARLRPRWAAVSFFLVVLSALVLHHIPDAVLDLRLRHFVSDVGEALRELKGDIAVPLLLAAVPLSLVALIHARGKQPADGPG
jgi:hypothetical protein